VGFCDYSRKRKGYCWPTPICRLSVLALLLERVIEQACGDTWRNIRAALAQIKLAQLLSPHGEVWQVTEPSSEADNHLKCLELKNPPAILHLR
jgi:hypothetical protein